MSPNSERREKTHLKKVLLTGPLVPLLVALAAHGASLPGQLVMDDLPGIVQHPVVNGEAPWWRVLDYNHLGAQLPGHQPILRPLPTLVFAAMFRAWGAGPLPYHCLGLALYLLVIWRVQRVLRALEAPPVHAMTAAAVFASLAIHVDVTAAAFHVSESMALLLSLTALHQAIRGRHASSVIALVLALLSKESAVMTPVALVAFLASRDGPRSLWQVHRRSVLLFLGVSLGFVALRAVFLSIDVGEQLVLADNQLFGQGIAVRLWMPFVLLGKYLSLTLVPVGLSVDYTYSAIPVGADLSDWHGWGGVLFTLGSSLLSVHAWRHRRMLAPRLFFVGWLGFLSFYALASNSVLLITIIFAERLFFAPTLWLTLMALALVLWIAPLAPAARRWWPVLASGLIIVQAPLAVSRSLEWRDGLSLLGAQVQNQPDSVKGQWYFAKELARRGAGDLALWHLGLGMSGRSRYPRPWRAPRWRDLPIQERLARLPGLISPEISTRRALKALHRASRNLLPGTAGEQSARKLARRLLTIEGQRK